MKTLPGFVGLALAVSGCSEPSPTEWRESYGMETVARAERHAERLIGFDRALSKARPWTWEYSWPGTGTINGYAVTCAQLAAGAVSGRKPGYDRVMSYSGHQIADAPSHAEDFDVLWHIGGCSGSRG